MILVTYHNIISSKQKDIQLYFEEHVCVFKSSKMQHTIILEMLIIPR